MPTPFPRTFYVANAIELFERMAFYGMFIGVSLYLTNVVGFGDVAVGSILGSYRLVASLAPIPCGAIADRTVWATYAAIGAACVAAMTVYRFATAKAKA